MIFSAALSLGLCALFFGSAVACVLCILSARVLKKSHLRSRFSLFCVFLSFSLALAAVFAIFVRKNFDIFSLFSSKSDLLFLIFLFALGFLICAFWKIFFIPCVVFYLLMNLHARVFLEGKFLKYPGTNSISVESENQEISLKIYKIPAKSLFFTRRFFYEIDDGKTPAAPAGIFSRFDSWLLGDVEERPLEIPKSNVYPILLKVEFESRLDGYEVRVSRTL